MTASVSTSSTILAAAIGAVLAFGTLASAPVHADPQARGKDRREQRSDQRSQKQEERYPNATRKAPTGTASRAVGKKLEQMNERYSNDDMAGTRVVAEEILADPKANDYEKAYAAQFASQAAYEADDVQAAIDYMQQAVDLNALDNNSHFGAMLNLAQMQQAADQNEAALATFEQFFAGSGSNNPQDLVMKGQALYLLERYAEAAQVIQEAIAASDNPNPQWQALLMQVYAESGDTAGAVRMAEQVAEAKPDDRRALLNLAVVYDQAGMTDKAIEVLERLRAGGQLETAAEYNQLYVTYLNMDGQERKAAEVITEGLDRGVLPPEHNTYVALAQAYYFSDQPGPAIEAYQKAAPLDDDGETYLNLAKVLFQEDRMAEAVQAARQALDKGVKSPDDARAIISAGN
ncbi:tetratricopeptide repeat protein [Lysobacter sp. GX 14042]|uniref:tetratricopeptide repeat protein n=1 Tax=Lysobacter sp. GX 14042 TaxID=2907155 RepID=UPI001F1FA507|nr:tetratricopeptide repeat protein [Lysobacter sp. GX 14042]MCE7032345.1 tetratricopeptide repeat protein [Lysobacter sp. GX 14042]